MQRTLPVVLLCLPLLLAAQAPSIVDDNQHVWASYSGDHPIKGRWGVHFDAQWRRADIGTEWQQYQARPALNYQLTPNILLTTGYAFTKSYPYGDYPARTSTPEHRIYQQVLLRHRWNSLRLAHRIRFEERFILYPDPQPRTWTYQNRFRYMLKVDVPLTRSASGAMEWYLPLFDEILIGIPPNYGARPFDHNRVFAGIGRATRVANVEAGYMNQYLGQRNGRIFESNNTLFFTITSNVPLGRLFGGD